MLVTLLKGFIVGLGASIPLGPLGVLCVQKTLSKGRNSGFITGLGASFSDTLYAAISLLGLAFIENLIDKNKDIVMIIGGAIIIYIGIRIFFTNPIKQIRQKNTNKKHVQDFIEAFLMTVTNPGAIFLILGLLAAVGININDNEVRPSVVVILLGVFMGTVTWWFTLSTGINVFRKKFRIRQLVMINRVSGAIMGVLGVIAMFDGIIEVVLKLLNR
ncbi:MAG: LysE family transporter [Bacteroidales bacterium]|nr:LysE family transporter [Bacteroidales bacterium]